MVQIGMISDKWLLKYTPLEKRNFNQNFVILFKGVLDIDLKPHPEAGTQESEVMM